MPNNNECRTEILKQDIMPRWAVSLENPKKVDPRSLASQFSITLDGDSTPRRADFAMTPEEHAGNCFIDGARVKDGLVIIFIDGSREQYRFLLALHRKEELGDLDDKNIPEVARMAAVTFLHVGGILECQGDFGEESPEDVLKRAFCIGRFKLWETMLRTCRATFLDGELREESDYDVASSGLLMPDQ